MAETLSRSSGEVLPPPSPIEGLAEILCRELGHVGLTEGADYLELLEGEKEIYRSVIEGLLLSWPLLERGRAELVR
jgi:hypothetical protein